MLLLSILIMHPPPRPTLFPYTTLFRSMVVEPNANVVFLHQLFDGVDGFNRLGGNAVEAEFPGELKYFPRACLVLRDANDAVVDGLEVMLGELVFDLLNELRGRIVVPFHVWLVRTELLVGIKLDDLAA